MSVRKTPITRLLPPQYQDLFQIFDAIQRELVGPVEEQAEGADAAAETAQNAANTAQTAAATAQAAADSAQSSANQLENRFDFNLDLDLR